MRFKVKAFSTVRISVNNVEESKLWYQALFTIAPIEEVENFARFKIQSVYFDITLADAKSPLSTGGTVAYWLIDNIEELVKHAQSIGGIVYRGPLRVEEIQRTIVQIQDPFGNVIGFEAPF